MPDIPELGSAAARERAAAQVAEVAQAVDEALQEESTLTPVVPVTTAFIVAWINGEVIVSADLNQALVADHYPTPDEVLGAAAVIAADRGAERTAGLAVDLIPGLSAEATVNAIAVKQQEAMAALQEAQNQALGKAALDAEQRGRRRG